MYTPEEQKIYKIVKRVLEWAEVKATEEEIADLIMLELVNIK